ncbi:MAG TPA: hypothetical protein PKI17_06790, partial [Syntrophomonas sp.]|nr:hypothetical protein [Syntrophomonas sp.]
NQLSCELIDAMGEQGVPGMDLDPMMQSIGGMPARLAIQHPQLGNMLIISLTIESGRKCPDFRGRFNFSIPKAFSGEDFRVLDQPLCI